MTNKNFCPASWVSLYVEPNGRVDSCCVGRNELGNLNDTPLNEILVGSTNTKVQRAMLDNQVVPGCSWCHNSEQNLQQTFVDAYPTIDDTLYQAGEFKLKYLDVRWNNTCNLACVYCGPTFSSLWAQEVSRVIKIERETKNSLLDYILENVEELDNIYLAGGEPLLMKENELLVDALIERNPKCKLLVNTNLSNTNTRVYQQLTKLENVRWLVSVEDIGQRYEYIRYPAQWNTFEQNLLALKDLVGMDRVYLNMVYCSLNYLSFWDTIDWAVERGFKKEYMSIALYNNGVFDGPFDLQALSEQHRKLALDRMQKSDYSMIYGYQKTVDYLTKNVTINSTLITTLTELDQRRNLNSRAIFPEVYQAIES